MAKCIHWNGCCIKFVSFFKGMWLKRIWKKWKQVPFRSTYRFWNLEKTMLVTTFLMKVVWIVEETPCVSLQGTESRNETSKRILTGEDRCRYGEFFALVVWIHSEDHAYTSNVCWVCFMFVIGPSFLDHVFIRTFFVWKAAVGLALMLWFLIIVLCLVLHLSRLVSFYIRPQKGMNLLRTLVMGSV